MWHNLLQNLGLVPGGARSVKPMPANLRGLVPKPADNNVTVKPSVPDVEKDTMPLIIDKVKRTLWQTKKLAAHLKGATLEQTLRNNSHFILDYIAYKKDDPKHEQIRSPRRLVHDLAGDCDCFAVLLASLLTNQGIKFKYRITRYSGKEWSHIYIVVPKDQRNENIELTNRTQYYVLDPVTNQHNYEVDFTAKKDFPMALQYLDGVGMGTLGQCSTPTVAQKSVEELSKLRTYVDNATIKQQGFVPTEEFLQDNGIPYEVAINPTTNGSFLKVDTPQGTVNVPTIITKTEADQINQAIHQPVAVKKPIDQVQTTAQPVQETAQPTQPEVKEAGTNWWGLLMVAGVALSAMKNEGSGTGLPPGLGGVKRKKIKVLHL